MAKVTGIGGVFLRARDPKALAAWYAEHLGFPQDECGGTMFSAMEESEGKAITVWSVFPSDTDYFGAVTQQAMVNYRVDDLDAMLQQLQQAGAKVDPNPQDYGELGRFGWAFDPEGNRFELWQPLPEQAVTPPAS